MAEFTRVGNRDEIPEGGGKAFEVNGRCVAVFNVGGSYYAIDNTCPHLGAPLADGFLAGEQITCPWHQWVFNVRTGQFAMHPDTALETFAVKVEGHDLLVVV